jgi:hypothetical protein
MGKEIRNELFDQVSALYATLDKGMMPISFFAPNLPLPAHLARNKARVTMCKLFEGPLLYLLYFLYLLALSVTDYVEAVGRSSALLALPALPALLARSVCH